MNNSKKLSLFREGNSESMGLTDIPSNNSSGMGGINAIQGLALNNRQMQAVSAVITGEQTTKQCCKGYIIPDPKTGEPIHAWGVVGYVPCWPGSSPCPWPASSNNK